MVAPLNAADVVAKKLRAMRIVVEVNADAPGKKIFLRRPLEASILRMQQAGSVGFTDIAREAEGWEGITEADILGADQGSIDQPVGFSAELFELYVQDDIRLQNRLLEAFLTAMNVFLEKREAATKNS